jgi:hypothetical protein
MLREARENYRYVPARLVTALGEPDLAWADHDIDLKLVRDCPTQAQWNDANFRARHSSIGIDNFHSALLNGSRQTDLLHGLVSTVFWGFASGSDGVIRQERALGKARCVPNGRGAPGSPRRIRPQAVFEIVRHMIEARQLLAEKNPGAALLLAMKVQFLGMSFASKLLMFMNPTQPWYTTASLRGICRQDPSVRSDGSPMIQKAKIDGRSLVFTTIGALTALTPPMK